MPILINRKGNIYDLKKYQCNKLFFSFFAIKNRRLFTTNIQYQFKALGIRVSQSVINPAYSEALNPQT